MFVSTDSWVRKIPWRRIRQPFQYACLGNPMDKRSLEGCSPWGLKELDMTQQLNTHTHTHTHIFNGHQVCGCFLCLPICHFLFPWVICEFSFWCPQQGITTTSFGFWALSVSYKIAGPYFTGDFFAYKNPLSFQMVAWACIRQGRHILSLCIYL